MWRMLFMSVPPKVRPPPAAVPSSSPGKVWRRLLRQHPDATIELQFRNPVELLVAVILSAQCTDRRVNEVTPALFRRFPGPADYLAAAPGELERYLHPLGFFRQKSRFIRESMARLLANHQGRVPDRMEDLLQLPGVGRKTANVILSNAFGVAAGIAVDTHVRRLARRLGWTAETDPDKIEQDLLRLFPKRAWPRVNHVLVFHGRYICRARRPDCGRCQVRELCPSALADTRPGGGRASAQVE